MHFSHLFYIFNISFNFCLALLLQASLIYSPLQIILLKDRRSAVVRDILNEKCSKCNSKCSCWYFLTFFVASSFYLTRSDLSYRFFCAVVS